MPLIMDLLQVLSSGLSTKGREKGFDKRARKGVLQKDEKREFEGKAGENNEKNLSHFLFTLPFPVPLSNPFSRPFVERSENETCSNSSLIIDQLF